MWDTSWIRPWLFQLINDFLSYLLSNAMYYTSLSSTDASLYTIISLHIRGPCTHKLYKRLFSAKLERTLREIHSNHRVVPVKFLSTYSFFICRSEWRLKVIAIMLHCLNKYQAFCPNENSICNLDANLKVNSWNW